MIGFTQRTIMQVFMGWCMREPYCSLSSAVCNTTIPTLPLYEITEYALCSPFCNVSHYLYINILQHSTAQHSTVQYSAVHLLVEIKYI